MQQKNEELQQRFKLFDRRLTIWQILAVLFFVGLIIHLFMVQIVDLKHYRLRAKRQRSANSSVMRGTIVDVNDIKLASDKVIYDVWAHPGVYDHSIDELATALSPILQIPYNKLKAELSKDYKIISLKKDIDRKTAKEVAKLHFREISLDKKTERTYPQGTLAAHVLGYYNTDAGVAGGVEFTAKKELEDVGKKINFEETPDGDIIYSLSTNPELTTTPLHGKTVKLTIDTAIQHVCEEELTKMIQAKNALRGTAIVLNPNTGEILGYSVYPTYNPNNFKKATATQLKNWTLTDIYPPGSTFKILTVTSAIELGKANEFTRVNDTGKITIAGHEIKNHDYHIRPHPGFINLVYLFEHSSNIGAIRIAEMMTSQEFYGMLKKFGIGSKTGIDLPGESKGLLKNPKYWDKSDHAAMGYGYGASVTPIQMITAISAIANGGYKITPHVIKYSPEEEIKKVKKEQIISEQTSKRVTRLLAQSIENSDAPEKLDTYTVAAKTGTSKKPLENGKGYSNKYYTSVIGFFPASNPQVLIYVVIDSPTGYGVFGSTVAAPVFKEIALQTARILNIPPDKVTVKKESRG